MYTRIRKIKILHGDIMVIQVYSGSLSKENCFGPVKMLENEIQNVRRIGPRS